jgi:hypothetical protein
MVKEVIDEGGEILENLKKVNRKDVYWTSQRGRI